MTQLPDVPERSATGRIALIYADIRATLGISIVNLIYRHLATSPEVLEWAWGAVRPHFTSGAIGAQAAAIRDQVGQHVAPWRSGWHLTASSKHDAVAELLRAYNVGNSLNLVAMTHLLGASGSGPALRLELKASAAQAAEPATLPGLPGLPGLPAMQELAADDAQRVLRLNRYGEPGEPGFAVSLYRHLAVWPESLSSIETMLAPLERQGLLDAGRRFTISAAARAAREQSFDMPAQPVAFKEHYAPRMRQFATASLPKMLPIGIALHDAFAGA